MKIPIHGWLIGLAVVVAVGGCAAPQERVLSTTLPGYVALPDGRNPLRPDELVPGLEHFSGGLAKLELRHGRALQILQLSGGGQNGAFGAGVLRGWADAGTRPKFDLVTGISTGALQSTFAFLGTPQDDEALADVFTHIDHTSIYVDRGIVGVLAGANSLLTTGPLRALIDKHITADVLRRVAAEFDKGRVLVVGTANLDLEELWVWNMTKLAKEGTPEALETYRRVLQAAASPPVAFPPVEIAGYLFADGATLNNLLIAGLAGPSTIYTQLPGDAPGRIYVIHNGTTQRTPAALPNDFKSIIGKSLGLMMDAQMASSLMRSYAVAAVHGYEWKMVRVPENIKLDANALKFDREEMNALYRVGRGLGKSGRWHQQPPPSDEVAPWLIEAVRKLQP